MTWIFFTENNIASWNEITLFVKKMYHYMYISMSFYKLMTLFYNQKVWRSQTGIICISTVLSFLENESKYQ